MYNYSQLTPSRLLSPTDAHGGKDEPVQYSASQTQHVKLVNEIKHNLSTRRADSNPEGVYIALSELRTIVDYKLALGQNRPTLRALISRNSEEQVIDVTRRAFAVLSSSSLLATELEVSLDDHWNIIKDSMDILCELKGVGPATASLILSLYCPTTIPFFSDEVTTELLLRPVPSSTDGSPSSNSTSAASKGGSIKYTMNTYHTLYLALIELARKINENGRTAQGEDPSFLIRGAGELERAIWRSCWRRDHETEQGVTSADSNLLQSGKRAREGAQDQGEGRRRSKRKKN